MVPIFKEKGDIRYCSCYGTMKPLEHGMKVVERVLVTVSGMQFGFMPQRGAIDDVFILTRLQEEYHANGEKLYMCFVDLEKFFDRVPRKVLEWAIDMRKKGIPKVLVTSVNDV